MTRYVVFHCKKCGVPIRRTHGCEVPIAQSYSGSDCCKKCDNYNKNAHVKIGEH